jgi:hypothetical protein
MGMCRGCSSLTMRSATRNVQMMHSQLDGWSKVCMFFEFSDLSSFPQHQGRVGHIMLVDHACVVAHYLPENINTFISQKTIPPCLTGSRAWSKSFVNMGCGQKRGCLLSVRGSSAPVTAWTAAAGVSFIFSQISPLSVPSSRN